MPNCFILIRKSDPEAGPVAFSLIDDEMRSHFNEPPDPEKYLGAWYDTIGTSLAMGHTWDRMRETYKTDGTREIIAYLEERFSTDAWYQPK